MPTAVTELCRGARLDKANERLDKIAAKVKDED
jgi:hypothetical protein